MIPPNPDILAHSTHLLRMDLPLNQITTRLAPNQSRLGLGLTLVAIAATWIGCGTVFGEVRDHSTYRFFTVIEEKDQVAKLEPIPSETTPRWADGVSQTEATWSFIARDRPYFRKPIPFVIAPEEGSGEPFHPHNHQPDIAWLPNGDLLAIWYTTRRERGTELTVLASRLRSGNDEWDPSSEFFKADDRNMHGNSLYYDEATGLLHHLNGMGRQGSSGWEHLALLHRYSRDSGVTWSVARPVSSGANYQRRHQVISGIVRTRAGILIQPCDAAPGMEGPTAIHVSKDGGKTWSDAGGDIRGIHAGVESLSDGRLMAFGRGQSIEEKMPISLSQDLGKTWVYSASEFPPIGGGQRLVFMRLREGPLLLVTFTEANADEGRKPSAGMDFTDENGETFTGYGMFAAVSYDEGETWPVRKLLTPGAGRFDGHAWTGVFETTPARAEHAGYLAATQSPDNVIHLISSGLHYRFNLKWLETPSEPVLVEL